MNSFLSIIQKSQLEGVNRLDAEYFQSEYLQAEKSLLNTPTKKISEISTSVVNFGAYSLCNYIIWQDSGVPYLNVENIKDGFIDFEDVKYVDDRVNEILSKSKVREGQIIIPMAGTIGNAAVAYKIPIKTNSNQATAKITLKDDINPFFVSTFLNSYYGKLQTRREILSSVQPNIFLWQIKNFKIPMASIERQNEIGKIWVTGLDELENSESIYKMAENLLLQELGLKDFKPKENLSYTVNLSEIEEANRTDSNYFQPKYKELLDKVCNKTPKPLSAFVKNFSTGYPFKSERYNESGVPLIRINNIKKGSLDLINTAFLSKEDSLLSPKDIAKSGDIVLSMSGTIGATSLIPENIPVCSVNQRILKFTPQNINPEYLVLLLNSIVGSYQLERIGTGGVQTNISYKDIQNILIPVLPKETQWKIADLVRQSHEARKKSKELLEGAKRKVEEMIEKGGDKNAKESN